MILLFLPPSTIRHRLLPQGNNLNYYFVSSGLAKNSKNQGRIVLLGGRGARHFNHLESSASFSLPTTATAMRFISSDSPSSPPSPSSSAAPAETSSSRLHSTDIAFKPAESGWGSGSKYNKNYDSIFSKRKKKENSAAAAAAAATVNIDTVPETSSSQLSNENEEV